VKISAALFGLFVCVLACPSLAAETARPGSGRPLTVATCTLSPGARPQFLASLQRFADDEGYAVRIAQVSPAETGVLVQMFREDLKVLGSTPFDAGKFDLAFYSNDGANVSVGDAKRAQDTLLAKVQGASCKVKAAAEEDGRADDPLTATIAALDTASFDAFNHCDQPGQLDKYASYFAPELEFYHDQGGVTWTREAMIANTRKNVCGHFRRELVPGSMRVYPIKDFGAIEQGEHTFCQFDSGKCEGIADFVIVWRLRDQRWEATRVLSYGHRANVPSKQAD